MHITEQKADGKSRYSHVDGALFTKKDMISIIGGEFEIADLPSGDYLLSNIIDQKQKVKAINKIATSLLRQKVYGPCLILTFKEANDADLL